MQHLNSVLLPFHSTFDVGRSMFDVQRFNAPDLRLLTQHSALGTFPSPSSPANAAAVIRAPQTDPRLR
jgi:hypothetical protein